jgi:hypothetical protein
MLVVDSQKLAVHALHLIVVNCTVESNGMHALVYFSGTDGFIEKNGMRLALAFYEGRLLGSQRW